MEFCSCYVVLGAVVIVSFFVHCTIYTMLSRKFSNEFIDL